MVENYIIIEIQMSYQNPIQISEKIKFEILLKKLDCQTY